MDKNNVKFVLTNGEYGYKAGDFFSAAMEIIFEVHSTQERYNLWETMVAHADERHKGELRLAFPRHVAMVESVFNGERTRNYAFGYCMMTLSVLPALLPLALPELYEAIQEYAQS